MTQSGAAPVITSASASAGSIGSEVTVTGTGFGLEQDTGVLFLGNKAGTVVSWGDTQIVATVALGAMTGSIQVRQNGALSNAMPFSVAAPTITNTVVSGSQVTITGIGFGATQGDGQVWLGTAAGTVVSWSDTQIVATVAPGANAGNIQVLRNGALGNAMPYTINNTPHINSLSPSTGAAGTSVTVNGVGFGVSQGSNSIAIAGLTPTVASWSDTAIAFTVPSNAVTGVVKIQRNNFWSNAVTFTVPVGSAPQITLSPNVVTLVAGEVRTLQALDTSGDPATGLAWTSSDTSVATLSTDDPPVITAVAPGRATIRAGSASADITVYNAGEMPLGTTLWSAPGPASGVAELKIAVPNYDAVADVFAVGNDSSVQAITSDGMVAWTASSPIAGFSSFMPDFQGGIVSYDDESIYRLDPLTGQPIPLYTNANEETRNYGLAKPAIHTDGTLFTVDYACHDWCDDADPVDGAWVVGLNSATGATKFRVPLANWTYTWTIADASLCSFDGSSDGTQVQRSHAWPNGDLKIAGDGYAYLSYYTFESIGSTRKMSPLSFSEDAYPAFETLWEDLGDPIDWDKAIADYYALWAAAGWSETSTPLLSRLQNHDRIGTINAFNQAGLTRIFLHRCDSVGVEVTKLHLMRVGPDGSFSDVVAKEWRDNISTTLEPRTEFPVLARDRDRNAAGRCRFQ